MRDDHCEEPSRPASESRDPFRLKVTLNGQAFKAEGPRLDALIPLYQAWLAAHSLVTQDDLDALVAGQERTARKLETIRDTLRVIAKPWKKRT